MPDFDSYVESLVAAAPPLVDEQVDALRTLLAPVAHARAA